MEIKENDIVLENTRLYNLCSSIIALNARSMIEEKTPEELYKTACRGGQGSKIAVKRLKQIYPGHKMTNETIRDVIKDYYKTTSNTTYQRCGPIEFWDVSGVTDMGSLFRGLRDFNEDISRWDVSSVTTMYCMFHSCRVFNSDISEWDVSSVTDMNGMLIHCTKFNSDISGWNVSSVTDMKNIFYNCRGFNSDISKWNVSSVDRMSLMFFNCSNFNRDLSQWDVSSVTNMMGMFNNCSPLKSEFEPEFLKKFI